MLKKQNVKLFDKRTGSNVFGGRDNGKARWPHGYPETLNTCQEEAQN